MPAAIPRLTLPVRIRCALLVGVLIAARLPGQGNNSSWPESSSSPPTSPALYLITFFPPTPPIYGGVLPEPSKNRMVFNGKSLDAPEDIADFVGETFYPALSTRLFEGKGKLSGKLPSRLEAYQAARAALLDDLMLELWRVRGSPKAERLQALQAFAPKQVERLAALEKEAEQLRRDLVKGGMFSERADWNAARGWRLGSPDVSVPPLQQEAEFQVARGTAFFQEGFSIEQRGLLLELALEQVRAARVKRGQRSSPDDDPTVIFFAPETGRFHLPSPLPPELFTKVGRFNSEKAALKRELLDALIECDALPVEKRASRFSTLAFEHERRIAALETDAEEIRLGLDALPESPAPWVPPIPLELRERIEAYNRDRRALLAAYNDAQARARAQMPAGHDREQWVKQAAEGRAAARRFEDEHADEIDTLRARYDRIRSDLEDAADGLKDPRTGRAFTMETLLDAYRVAMQRFDTIGREEAMYDRYKIALLQPGLSPAQRRLLFRAAHASLAQALPLGEVMMSRFPKPMVRP